jgi:hypothetical protein
MQHAANSILSCVHAALPTPAVAPVVADHGQSCSFAFTLARRDMASGKVVAVKFVPRPLAKSAIPFMMAEVEIQVRAVVNCYKLSRNMSCLKLLQTGASTVCHAAKQLCCHQAACRAPLGSSG